MSLTKKILLGLATLSIVALLFAPAIFAADPPKPLAGDQGLLSSLSPECYTKGNCELCDIIGVANNIIKLILGITGSLALAAFALGGFWIVVSQGDSGKVQKGYKVFKSASFGIALVFFSYTIVNFVLNILISSGSPAEFNFANNIFTTDQWSKVCAGAPGIGGKAAVPPVICNAPNVLDSMNNVCVAPATCPAGQYLVPSRKVCEVPKICPTSQTYESETNTCQCRSPLTPDAFGGCK